MRNRLPLFMTRALFPRVARWALTGAFGISPWNPASLAVPEDLGSLRWITRRTLAKKSALHGKRKGLQKLLQTMDVVENCWGA